MYHLMVYPSIIMEKKVRRVQCSVRLPEPLWKLVSSRALREHRSINAQVLYMVEQAAAIPQTIQIVPSLKR